MVSGRCSFMDLDFSFWSYLGPRLGSGGPVSRGISLPILKGLGRRSLVASAVHGDEVEEEGVDEVEVEDEVGGGVVGYYGNARRSLAMVSLVGARSRSAGVLGRRAGARR